jgi:hypothetical protein
MASKSATAERQNAGQSRPLSKRHLPFAGLLLMPPTALIVGLVVHFALPSDVARGLTACGVTALTSLLAALAHSIGAGRKAVVRWHVVGTVILVGLGEAVTLLVGLTGWWLLTSLIVGEFVAASWALYRIDAFRQRTDQPETEDSLRKELGLEGTRFGRPVHHRDATGEVTRIEVPVKHAPGQTVNVIQDAVPAIESLAGAPRGRSRAVPTESANASNLVIITKDVLKDLVPYAGPSSPGGCITDPLLTSIGEDQQFGLRYIAGGRPEAPNPSSTGWMGMTRTGKTLNAQIGAMEIMSRHNAQMFWFDTVKGAQTVRPLRKGLDVIVASDDKKVFRAGMKALMALIRWRADRLGGAGYRSWTPEAAKALGMPFLVAHFEEADELCDIAPDEMVFLASKGLSTGVSCGFSLQRASAESMPTGLRFNIGNWYCFGTGDDYSAGFALSSATIDAGAHPENWKQSKPGYHYFEGIGVDEQRWPIVHKSMFATDAQMEAHTDRWAPQMMPLDAGSISALGPWYAAAKAETQQLVDRWNGAAPAADVVHDGAMTSANTTLNASAAAPDSTSAEDADGDDIRAEIEEDIEAMRASGEIPELTDDNGQPDTDGEAIDPTKPIPAPAGEELSWGDPDGKIPATDREQALAAFVEALRQIAADQQLRDPDDPDTTLFQVDTLVQRYKFRSRPWFAETLTGAADGTLDLPDGLVLTRRDKPGHYTLRRLATVSAIGDGA